MSVLPRFVGEASLTQAVDSPMRAIWRSAILQWADDVPRSTARGRNIVKVLEWMDAVKRGWTTIILVDRDRFFAGHY